MLEDEEDAISRVVGVPLPQPHLAGRLLGRDEEDRGRQARAVIQRIVGRNWKPISKEHKDGKADSSKTMSGAIASGGKFASGGKNAGILSSSESEDGDGDGGDGKAGGGAAPGIMSAVAKKKAKRKAAMGLSLGPRLRPQ